MFTNLELWYWRLL